MDRPQVNIRLERDLLADLDDLARAEQVDRAELARRLLRHGLARERLDLAVRQYREGAISASRAAEVGRVSLYEMLDRIHLEGIPYELDQEELARVDEAVARVGAAEGRTPYEADVAADRHSGIARLREDFRPSDVRTLFVGESSPAGGTHFYRANSNLFRATHEAFVAAHGTEVVPDGPRFLHWFRDKGCWLVDLADRPVNRLPGRPRKDAVDAGVDRLAQTIRQAQPDGIIVVKASIGAAVRQAARVAGYDGEIAELPFPVRQWRSLYVRQLAALLAAPASANRSSARGAERTGQTIGPSSTTQTQRVTASDIRGGRIRIPSTGAAKSMLPPTRTRIDIVLRGRVFNDRRYDPHHDPDQERSGVISVPRNALYELVRADERLSISVDDDGRVRLD